MGAPQYEQAGADVAGSGTLNTIPRWTGATTLGDSLITQSGAFTGVNCGAGLPTQALHVVGNVLATLNSVSGQSIQLSPGNSYGVLGSGSGLLLNAAAGMLLDGTFHTFRSAGGATTRMAIDTSGNVGIGTASPAARLHALASATYAIFASTSNTGYIELRHTTSTTAGYVGSGSSILSGAANNDIIVRSEGAGGAVKLATNGNNLRASVTDTSLDISSTSGYGLKLPATPGNTDPNTLDCYADGGTANSGGVTWTPTLKFGGATTGITYTFQIGRYTRIGNMVFAQCHIGLSSKGSATGIATIDGLPTMANVTSLYASPSFGYLQNLTIGDQVTGIMFPNATQITLYKSAANANPTNMTDADFAATSAIIFTICYPVT